MNALQHEGLSPTEALLQDDKRKNLVLLQNVSLYGMEEKQIDPDKKEREEPNNLGGIIKKLSNLFHNEYTTTQGLVIDEQRDLDRFRLADGITTALEGRIKKIIKDQEGRETEYHFSMDTLDFFRTHARELMNHGFVPVLREHEYDRYGLPIYPTDKLFENGKMPTNLGENAFIALVKCPTDVEISDFIPPMKVEDVEKAAEESKLGFSEKFGHTSHMAVATLINGSWGNQHVVIPNVKYACEPLEQIKQYGTGLFEGIGVELGEHDEIIAFRLEEHARRMYEGAKFFDMMPKIEDEREEKARYSQFKQLFTKMVIDTIRANEKFIPPHGKGRLYIRPCFFDHGPKMNADISGRFMMTMTAVPIGSAESYFKPGHAKFLMPIGRTRVASGTKEGMAKADAHYGKVARIVHTASKHGMKGVLFADAMGERVEETQASGALFIQKLKNGNYKLIAPSLKHGTILDSITRKSCLDLANEMLGWEVEEKDITLKELEEQTAVDANGQHISEEPIIEAVAAGTGAALSPIHEIQKAKLDSETDEIIKELGTIHITDGDSLGPQSKRLFNILLATKSGRIIGALEELARRNELVKGSLNPEHPDYENAITELGQKARILDAGKRKYGSWITVIPRQRNN